MNKKILACVTLLAAVGCGSSPATDSEQEDVELSESSLTSTEMRTPQYWGDKFLRH
jgi:uncharacterized protein YcfL